VLRVERADEEVARLGQLDVVADALAERERIAVEVREQARKRAARRFGLDGRPLTGEAEHLGREGLDGVAVEVGPREQRLLGAVDLEDVRAPGRDAHEQSDDAFAGDHPCGPQALEALADLVEPNHATEPVEHVVEGAREVGERREV
jgi:hypothetical protein